MPAYDIDLVECYKGLPVALIDFKHPTRNYVDLNCGEVKFYNTMAAPHNALAFVNIYFFYNRQNKIMEDWEKQEDETHRQHRVVALNDRTYNAFGKHRSLDLTELEYVDFLYKIRKEKMPANLAKTFCSTWRQVSNTEIKGETK